MTNGVNVHASPSSINELRGVADIRTLDKLVDGANNTWDDQHMWLTIYDPGKVWRGQETISYQEAGVQF